jgi:hypothetical protein
MDDMILTHARLILTYFDPFASPRGSFPRPKLLEAHPRLAETYAPFVAATRNGDIADYDEHLEAAQTRLVGLIHTWPSSARARMPARSLQEGVDCERQELASAHLDVPDSPPVTWCQCRQRRGRVHGRKHDLPRESLQ